MIAKCGWPYSSERPSLHTLLCYKIETSQSFAALAHHIKFLWSCIRWDSLRKKRLLDDVLTTENDSEIITHEYLAKCDIGQLKSCSEYLVRKIIYPIDKKQQRGGTALASQRQLNQQPITTMTKLPTSAPFIVRIPHLQPKTGITTESGKVVIVKSDASNNNNNNNNNNPSTMATMTFSQQPQLQQQTQAKTFSIVKLPDGQIILVPTTTTQQQPQQIQTQSQQTPHHLNENEARIVKAASPATTPKFSERVIKRVTKQQVQTIPLQNQQQYPNIGTQRLNTISITNLSNSQKRNVCTINQIQKEQQPKFIAITTGPQLIHQQPTPERRLRSIAPAPTSSNTTTSQTHANLLSSLLSSQQQQLLLQAQQQLHTPPESTTEDLLKFDPTANLLYDNGPLLSEDDLTMISGTVTVDGTDGLQHTMIPPPPPTKEKKASKRKAPSTIVTEEEKQPLPSVPRKKTQKKNSRKLTSLPLTETTLTPKARLEKKALSVKETRKKMTPRRAVATETVEINNSSFSLPPPVQLNQQQSTKPKYKLSEHDILELSPVSNSKKVTPEKTKRQSASSVSIASTSKQKVDPEDGIRLKVCEGILRSLLGTIEREERKETAKKNMEKHSTIQPKHEHRQIHLHRLLNDRVENLRQDFLKQRLQRKQLLVKEQVQQQRFKQQQLVLKQQQEQVKTEQAIIESRSSSEEQQSSPTKKTPKATKYSKKKLTNEQETPKSSPKQASKRLRTPMNNTEEQEQPSPTSKKPRQTRHQTSSSLHRPSSSSDNDENKQKKTSAAKIKTTTISAATSSQKKKFSESIMNPADIDCVCKNNSDTHEKFFVQCELCSKWLHGKCVGRKNERIAEKMDEFICADCQALTQRAKERLYCVCRTPYDESKFYIGCDICQDWYHGKCVGITPDDAEKFEVYVCPRCSTEKKQEFLNKPIKGDAKKKLLNLIEQLLTHKMAWPFQNPVDVKDVPNYYKIIKDPMDLTTLKSKVLASKYKTVCDFIRDVNKIFNNCRAFNPIDSPFSQCANVVDNYFRHLLENLMIKDEPK
ncbi:unnamed protein product [Didymodactylos carnosus]|uniref:Uncharacterized protein n=1 Tax=Didymodactylos carnosus TaxID=1234261 RepID=A0A814GQ83_9BILA|nr:unnamed protein product [Didymodactylos carnosus]CAF3771002.1 unnamed protein product [Didymodactylos carnosus]